MNTQLIWLRNDLRLADQPAVRGAAAGGPVAFVYVLDDETAGQWAMGAAQRWWLHHSLTALGADIAARGGRLILRRGRADTQVIEVATALRSAVHAIDHPEPWAKAAQQAVAAAGPTQIHDGAFLARPDSVRAGGGGRYRIFTPFWQRLQEQMPPPRPLGVPDMTFADTAAIASDDLDAWDLLPAAPDWSGGFDEWQPGEAGASARLRAFAAKAAGYDTARNFPSDAGTSKLSPHLALGEISPAAAWHAMSDAAGAKAQPWLRQLGWRDFSGNIIEQSPDFGDVPGREPFLRFAHRDDPEGLRAWQKGLTGYPIVDAGMRQLWHSGWMHNRVRMITASFLTKHLLIDWRHGERWFWDTLVDADYGNNACGWQWVMGSGTDSSPFPRIFAPIGQSEKFDAARYIRRWVPELATLPDAAIHAPFDNALLALGAGVRLGRDYPLPIVDHAFARARALAAFEATRAG
ncbi:deoxyribodipyrimidine photo-lyase [Sandarakinorhabdus sp.]|uniref:cryptochrome/photolyase family protein n=1 Tax=Sandarakinorhabdus sp. TaxID=1916663 RepID=UPI00286DD0FF|nr:deoxyribodipyrimidine photo-lyase [Sandarakinorhabdus sp.]